MSKNLKKILITGASLLMMASVGAGIGSTNASASGFYYVKHGTEGLSRGTRLSGSPVTSDEDSSNVYFSSLGEFLPWRDVGYHRNVAHHYYRRPARRHYRKSMKLHRHRARRAKKARKAIKRNKRTRRSRRIRKPRKATKFRKTAFYHNIWTKALRVNQKVMKYDLKQAAKYSKRGNTRAAKKAERKANNLKRFIKHDQAMLRYSSKAVHHNYVRHHSYVRMKPSAITSASDTEPQYTQAQKVEMSYDNRFPGVNAGKPQAERQYPASVMQYANQSYSAPSNESSQNNNGALQNELNADENELSADENSMNADIRAGYVQASGNMGAAVGHMRNAVNTLKAKLGE